MSFAFPPAMAVDLLAAAVRRAGADRAREIPVNTRIRSFWAAAIAARDLGASDVVHAEFRNLADNTGLIRDLGRNGHQDVRHVLHWALCRLNPFDNGHQQ